MFLFRLRYRVRAGCRFWAVVRVLDRYRLRIRLPSIFVCVYYFACVVFACLCSFACSLAYMISLVFSMLVSVFGFSLTCSLMWSFTLCLRARVRFACSCTLPCACPFSFACPFRLHLGYRVRIVYKFVCVFVFILGSG